MHTYTYPYGTVCWWIHRTQVKLSKFLTLAQFMESITSPWVFYGISSGYGSNLCGICWQKYLNRVESNHVFSSEKYFVVYFKQLV